MTRLPLPLDPALVNSVLNASGSRPVLQMITRSSIRAHCQHGTSRGAASRRRSCPARPTDGRHTWAAGRSSARGQRHRLRRKPIESDRGERGRRPAAAPPRPTAEPGDRAVSSVNIALDRWGLQREGGGALSRRLAVGRDLESLQGEPVAALRLQRAGAHCTQHTKAQIHPNHGQLG